MSQDSPLTFFEHPILNSPYAYPGRHWELDTDGQPANKMIESRRRSELITPHSKAKKRKAPKGPTAQVELELTADDEGLSTPEKKYDPTPIINEMRGYMDSWRTRPTPRPQSGEIESGGTDSIALWMIDTEFNEESFFVRQAYFLGASDPYMAQKTTLKAEIDAEAWATLNSDASRRWHRFPVRATMLGCCGSGSRRVRGLANTLNSKTSRSRPDATMNAEARK